MNIALTLLLSFASVLPASANPLQTNEPDVAGPFIQTSPEGPLLHRASNFSFPSEVACFHRSRARQYDTAGEDVSVTYYSCASVTLTLYVYPAGKKSLEAEFESRQEEVTSAQEGVHLLATSGIKLTPRNIPALSASYTFENEYGGKSQPLLSELLVGKLGTHFVEYRFTYPASSKESAVSEIAAFEHTFQWP